MRAAELYPLKLEPRLHVKVWGGGRLKTHLNKPQPSNEPYGESWELHDTSIVSNGALSGKSLRELTTACGAALIGSGNDPQDGFPLLAKFIDAEQWLSIQVHPNDEQALELEGEPRGKAEAWIVVHAEEGARLVIGVEPGASREDIAAAISENRLENYMRYAEVREGDVLTIPANTVHALGPGLLVYEIQQSSDTTYRLYDWGRRDLDGKPRQLYIDKGLQVANLDHAPEVARPDIDLVVDGEHFATWRHELGNDDLNLETDGVFQALTCLEGEIRAAAVGNESIALAKGETGLIPACFEEFALSGVGTVLRSCQRIPQSSPG
ncbi:MAG: class I mannose-6-phosphate isomerase [Chloroflexota bacterium]|nr:class I mannose-6-phosphate isomerase [Chloroflexota bacterium]